MVRIEVGYPRKVEKMRGRVPLVDIALAHADTVQPGEIRRADEVLIVVRAAVQRSGVQHVLLLHIT